MTRSQISRVESQQLSKRVIHFYKNVANKNSKVTWLHFKKEGCPKSTIYGYIKKFGESDSVKIVKNPGRTPKIATTRKLKEIKEYFKDNPSSSCSIAAKELNMDISWLKKIKIQKLGIRARVKQIVPRYKKDQEERVQKCCKKLFRKMSGKIVVIDDETYVPVDPANVPGREFFHS